MHMHVPAYVCVWIYMFMHIYTQVIRVCQDIPHHMSGTFNKHSSLAIFDDIKIDHHQCLYNYSNRTFVIRQNDSSYL